MLLRRLHREDKEDILYLSGAKQSKTRESRIEKCMDKIFDGIGVDE